MNDDDEETGFVQREDLVAVYAALLEVTQSEEECGVEKVAERADREHQMTEIALDELEHMGFVEIREDSWYPVIQFSESGE
ncbi:MAG: hypothetical protein ABEJ82_02825 [Haloplanus sp.]